MRKKIEYLVDNGCSELSESSKASLKKELLEFSHSSLFLDEVGARKEKFNEDEEFLGINLHELIDCVSLGMGRNRVISLLNTNRTNFEKATKRVGLWQSEIKRNAEQIVSKVKITDTSNKKREEELKSINWEELKLRYLNGEGVTNLAKEYKVGINSLKYKLDSERILDSSRSTIYKSQKAKNNESVVDDEVIRKVVREYPLEPKVFWFKEVKKEYPWMLRKQFFDKLDELDLNRSQDEVNEIRRIKSVGEHNTSYMTKLNSINLINQAFGSVDNLCIEYNSGVLGSYSKIANAIHNSTGKEISTRQVMKAITNNKNYIKKSSNGELQLLKFIEQTFPDSKVVNNFRHGNREIDVYIEDLKVGFEFNGEYWHSDQVINFNYGVSAREQHKTKADFFSNVGIRLLYVWENDWDNNYEEVEAAIRDKNWSAAILNKHSNRVSRSDNFTPPRRQQQAKKDLLRVLKNKNISYSEIEDNLFKISEQLIISIPSYRELSEKNYSIRLQKKYEKQGIELITILPWHNMYKMKELILYKLAISKTTRLYARDLELMFNSNINNEQKKFIELNHILGYNNFPKIDKTLVLMNNDEIVMLALFTKRNEASYELKRLISKGGYSIVGGASKLIKNYIKLTEGMGELITFSDCDLGFGNVYEKLGFSLIERSRPQLTWYNESLNQKFSNNSLVKVGADRLLRNIEGYSEVGVGDELPTNQEIVKSYNFIEVYDSGHKKWSLIFNIV